MRLRGLPRHDALQQATRLPWLGQAEAALPILEFAALLLFGAMAASASVLWDWSLRIPGHAILRAVFPMAMGLAFVPRRGAGTVMGLGAVLSLFWMKLGGQATPGWGASTSLLLTGPMMDLALWSAKPGWRIYISFALAGFATNFVAFAIRALTKYAGGPGGGGRSFAGWWPEAVFTYAICGVVAGVISAAVWFHAAGPKLPHGPAEPPAS